MAPCSLMCGLSKEWEAIWPKSNSMNQSVFLSYSDALDSYPFIRDILHWNKRTYESARDLGIIRWRFNKSSKEVELLEKDLLRLFQLHNDIMQEQMIDLNGLGK